QKPVLPFFIHMEGFYCVLNFTARALSFNDVTLPDDWFLVGFIDVIENNDRTVRIAAVHRWATRFSAIQSEMAVLGKIGDIHVVPVAFVPFPGFGEMASLNVCGDLNPAKPRQFLWRRIFAEQLG